MLESKGMNARMSMLWKFVGEEYGGIPQRILFLSYPKLEVQGMRWAPKPLLRVGTSTFAEGTYLDP